MKVYSQWFSCISYQKGLELQQNFMEKSRQTGCCYLLGLEHFPVITLGLKAQKTDILISTHTLNQKGIETLWIKRGGGATCHSPGQLVIYPIVPLKKCQLSVKGYMSLIEDVTRKFLNSFGIQCIAKQKQQPAAVYTAKGKIAFFGVHIQKGVTSHGLAINVSNDLSFFSFIRPCGLDFDNIDCVSHYYKCKPSLSLFEKWISFWKEMSFPKLSSKEG